ncbi:unnamed protein product [Symbiodinium microadriaticum]|nr:unnamed protein product [Symbiodinium microadriaticum]
MQAVPSGDAAQRCDSDIRAQQPPPAGMPMFGHEKVSGYFFMGPTAFEREGPEFQFVRSGFAVSGFVYEPFPLIQTRDPANAVDVERKPDHLAVPFQYLPCASAWTAGSVLSLQKSWTGKPENRTTAKAEYQRQLLAWMPSSATTPQSPLFKIFMSALAT